ncbi:MAG: autotransporter outer membrane beta-barrel domain-containing protein, partial [Sutterellaceae bacterium]|nr:autotransporter outer membrane beta-barrel domain-containing protein [Sutterellaceae bacterium]
TPITDTVINLDGATVQGNISIIMNGSSKNYGTGNEIRVTDSTITGSIRPHSSSKALGKMTFEGVNTVGRLEYVGELVLNVSEVNEQSAVLTLTWSNALDLTNATVVISGDDTVAEDGSYQLIDNKGGATISVGSNTVIEKKGVFVDNLWEVEIEAGQSASLIDGLQIVNGDLASGDLVIAIGQEKLNDNSKTLAESFLGSIAFVNQGAEFIADEGLRSMNASARADGFAAFGAIHGGSSRYETGSHIDVDGVSLATGVASRFGNLMVAGFVEAGWATSESHVDGTKGDGDHDYYGFGAALRYSFDAPFYVEGAARLGWASTEFDGRYANAAATYDADSFYGSVHVGAGYVWQINERLAVDLYGRYTFSYLEGDKVKMGGVDGIDFDMDDVTTHAFRIGTRLTGQINESADWRVGVAYEHVADGDAESSVIEKTRLALETPTLEGDTGIFEVGVRMTPSQASPWAFDVGLKGYVGDRKGVSGSALVTYAF